MIWRYEKSYSQEDALSCNTEDCCEVQYGTASSLLTPYRQLNLSLRTLVDRNAAVAEVTFVVNTPVGGSIYVKTGSSKREPGDPFDPDLGEQLAIARALRNLASSIEDDASARITAKFA